MKNNEDTFESVKDDIDFLYENAKQILDGNPIETETQAENVAILIDKIRGAIKRADALRKKEVEPLQARTKQIQEKYNQLIGDTKSVTGTAVLALSTAKDAVKPYLKKKADAARAEEERLRKEAEALEIEARNKAMSQSLDDREESDALLKDAQKAKSAAKNINSNIKSSGRAISGKKVKKAKVVDYSKLARFYWEKHPSRMKDVLDQWANQDVKSGRNLPGVEIIEDIIVS